MQHIKNRSSYTGRQLIKESINNYPPVTETVVESIILEEYKEPVIEPVQELVIETKSKKRRSKKS